MTREQLIEVMAKAECLHDDPKCNWEALPERHKDSYREGHAAVLDALTAAGMVVVPREPTEAMLKSGAVAFYGDKHDVLAGRLPSVYRAMIEAATSGKD